MSNPLFPSEGLAYTPEAVNPGQLTVNRVVHGAQANVILGTNDVGMLTGIGYTSLSLLIPNDSIALSKLQGITTVLLNNTSISTSITVEAALGRAQAQINNKQPLDQTLTGLSTLSASPGIVVQTSADNFAPRTITGTANQILVANGDGSAANPTISLATSITITNLSVTGLASFTSSTVGITSTVNSKFTIGNILYSFLDAGTGYGGFGNNLYRDSTGYRYGITAYYGNRGTMLELIPSGTSGFKYSFGGSTPSPVDILTWDSTGNVTIAKDVTINGIKVGLGSASQATNTIVGESCFSDSNITGNANVGIGYNAGKYCKSSNNVFIGYNALAATLADPCTGTNNIAIGYNVLALNSSGIANLAIGYNAMSANTAGVVNVAIGANALASNTDGSTNVAVGNNSLQSNVSGNQNTSVGYIAGNTINASDLTAVGYAAARYVSGSGNIAVGSGALLGSSGTNISGNYNIGIGYNAGSNIAAGGFNLFFGFFASGNPAGSYQIAIGRDVVTTRDNAGAWGGTVDSQRTDLGIGTFTPLSRLHVETITAANKGLIINAASGQSANLLEINDSSGTNLVKIGPAGQWGFGTALASSTGWSGSTASALKSLTDASTLANVISVLATLIEDLKGHGVIKT